MIVFRIIYMIFFLLLSIILVVALIIDIVNKSYSTKRLLRQIALTMCVILYTIESILKVFN
jgi:hypothetical protein